MFLKPARKIRPSNRSITGKCSSLKTNSSQHFESTLERDMLTLLEYNDEVDHYTVQPVTIYYEHENRTTRYTPDIAVYYKDELGRKPELIEMKYEAELQEKQDLLTPRFDAATKYAYQNGYNFRVITEKEIRTEYLYNIKFLSSYRRFTVENETAEKIINLFESKERQSPEQLLLSFEPAERPAQLYTLWQLLATKLLTCDMHQKIIMTTELWINQ